jgi:hypothetical protein
MRSRLLGLGVNKGLIIQVAGEGRQVGRQEGLITELGGLGEMPNSEGEVEVVEVALQEALEEMAELVELRVEVEVVEEVGLRQVEMVGQVETGMQS